MKNAWEKYDDNGIKEVFDFNEGYKNFISKCKTERECVKETIKIVEEKGYRTKCYRSTLGSWVVEVIN